MKEYTKIQTLFKRDMSNKGRIIEGEWSLPEFDYLKKNAWLFTEKVDGTNIRVNVSDGNIQFGGRTDAAQIPSMLLVELNKLFTHEKLLRSFDCDLADVTLYGEGYGAKIQNGGKYRNDQSFVLFDVLIGDWWLQRKDVEDVANKLGIDVVPIVGVGTLTEAIELVRNGMKSTWGDFISEGLVLRPSVELKTRGGNRIIGKIKHRDFNG